MDDWKPPTEAEMKVLNARRERQEKISQLMGQYLLKGYKMLGEVCSLCGVSLVYLYNHSLIVTADLLR